MSPSSSDPIPVHQHTLFQTLLKFTPSHPHQQVLSVSFTIESINLTRPHHSVLPEHQSVHQTPSISFTRASSELREVFRFLIVTKFIILDFSYHFFNYCIHICGVHFYVYNPLYMLYHLIFKNLNKNRHHKEVR